MIVRNLEDVTYLIKQQQNRIAELERALKQTRFDPKYYYNKVEVQKLINQISTLVKIPGLTTSEDGRSIFDFQLIVNNEAVFNGRTDFQGLTYFYDTMNTEDIWPRTGVTYNLGWYDDTDPLNIIDHRWLRIYTAEIRLWAGSDANRPLRTDLQRNVYPSLIDLSDNIDTIDPASGKQLKVENGGTGQEILPTNEVLLGNGTLPITSLPGTTGSINISVTTQQLGSLSPTDNVVTSVSIDANAFTLGIRTT